MSDEYFSFPIDSEPLPPQPCTEEKEVKSVVLDAAKNDQVTHSEILPWRKKEHISIFTRLK